MPPAPDAERLSADRLGGADQEEDADDWGDDMEENRPPGGTARPAPMHRSVI